MFPVKIQLVSILRGDISPYLGINSITNRIKKNADISFIIWNYFVNYYFSIAFNALINSNE